MFSHLDQYKDQFQKTRQVSISNLLHEPQAEEVWEAYLNSSEFTTSFFTEEYNKEENGYVHYAEKGTQRYEELTQIVEQIAAKDNFTYRFSRTQWTHPYLYNLWSSKIFIGAIEYITGFENLNWVRSSTFTSKYEAGDFLYTHTDKGNGRIAFVYQLTKNWLPGYGGLFVKAPDWIHVTSTILPEFNKLTIFDVAEEGVPHMVTKVIPNLNNSRIAYSGWLA